MGTPAWVKRSRYFQTPVQDQCEESEEGGDGDGDDDQSEGKAGDMTDGSRGVGHQWAALW